MCAYNKDEPLPKSLEKYFWDCDFVQLNMQDYYRFIVERVLNLGNTESVRWLLAHTEESSIRNVVNGSRNLSDKTRNFWKTILE